MSDSKIHNEVKDYYGKTLGQSSDLKTNACCTLTAPPLYIQEALKLVHDTVQSKYYGCGLVIPDELSGLKVLDLGSGSGRDCFILSKLVGEHGKVIGIDMTDEQLAVANEYIEFHRKAFGYKKSNIEFTKGNIDRLDELNLEINSFDLIISNCVINLVENKQKVLQDIYQLLKPGGEMYFSDVYSDRRIPQELIADPVLYGECLSGALYWNDFLSYAKAAGFKDPRKFSDEPITIQNEDVQKKVGNIQFYSVTYRLFKIEELEDACEDYGQAVQYKGTLTESKNSFKLDDHHYFETGRIYPICNNSSLMLSKTRYREHFNFFGDTKTHLGIFEGCGFHIPFSNINANAHNQNSGSCC